MELTDILAKLPYSKPFLFVDELLHVDENSTN
jgi:3-hydroxyacyl-[acyl-carrier-protein] dehydratase